MKYGIFIRDWRDLVWLYNYINESGIFEMNTSHIFTSSLPCMFSQKYCFSVGKSIENKWQIWEIDELEQLTNLSSWRIWAKYFFLMKFNRTCMRLKFVILADFYTSQKMSPLWIQELLILYTHFPCEFFNRHTDYCRHTWFCWDLLIIAHQLPYNDICIMWIV